MQFDVIVIGGSYAGLSAAMYIARGRHSVCVIDAGLPRNRSSLELHGLMGWDGATPSDIVGQARVQLQRYKEVTVLSAFATNARPQDSGFAIELETGEEITASKILLAIGVIDNLPDIPGLPAKWGRSVLHCPYCHGYELSGQRLGVLAMSDMSSQQAMMIANWGPTTYFLGGKPDVDPTTRAQLAGRDVSIEAAAVTALTGTGSDLEALELNDGMSVPIAALFILPRTRLGSPIAEQLGCSTEDGVFGRLIAVDAAMMTSVPGVYAAGDAMRSFNSATFAASDGVAAGASLSRALIIAA